MSSTEFKTWLLSHSSLSQASITQYSYYIVALEASLKGKEVTTEDINIYLRTHPGTAQRSAMGFYCRFKGLPIEGLIKFKSLPPRPHKLLTMEDAARVVNALEPENMFIAKFMLYTGARCHEVFKVKLSDITPEGMITLSTKGGKFREIMLPPDFHKELMNFLTQIRGLGYVEPIFYPDSLANLNVKRRYFWGALNETSLKVLGKRMGTHDFRRLVGVNIYKNSGNDINLTKRILGHADVSSTMRYIQYSTTKEDITNAMNILEKRIKATIGP